MCPQEHGGERSPWAHAAPYRANTKARALGKAGEALELMSCAAVSPTSNASAF